LYYFLYNRGLSVLAEEMAKTFRFNNIGELALMVPTSLATLVMAYENAVCERRFQFEININISNSKNPSLSAPRTVLWTE